MEKEIWAHPLGTAKAESNLIQALPVQVAACESLEKLETSGEASGPP